MRRAVQLAAVATLLGAPTALAFFSGGYFDEARLIATLGAWTLVLVVAAASPVPLPRAWPGRLALGGLALLAAWSGVALTWAPLSQPATASVVRLLLYLGALIAAAALLRARGARRAVEPALALGAVVVIGYGLAGRLVPGIVRLSASTTADGRLEQPLTYWNAEGALAAIGFVLCARLAGSAWRSPAVRAAAAAAAAPLGLGVYLSFSRGALAAAIVGLIVALAAAPTRAQLRAIAIAVAAAAAATAVAAALPGVATLAERERDGAIALAALLAAMAAAAILQARTARPRAEGPAAPASGEAPLRAREARAQPPTPSAGADRLAWASRVPALALAAVAVGLVVLVAVGLAERGGGDPDRRGVARLASVESQRYEYWRVGVGAFAADPLIGTGPGGFRVEWLRERPDPARALEVHSLPLEMAVELGLVGLALFAAFAAGIAAAGARALRAGDALAPGAVAGVTTFALHAAIDWDWQLPAVTLPALVLAGGLIAAAEDAAERGLTPGGRARAAARPPAPSGAGRSPA